MHKNPKRMSPKAKNLILRQLSLNQRSLRNARFKLEDLK